MLEQWSLPTIDLERCNGCGQCVEFCPGHAVDMLERRPAITRPQDCTYCGACEDACPQNAIALHYEIVLRPAAKPE